jgi:hypothetical protein
VVALSAGAAKAVPTFFSLPDVSCPRCCVGQPSARAAATASPPVRATEQQSTTSQGRAGRVDAQWGRACLPLIYGEHVQLADGAASPGGEAVSRRLIKHP